MGVSCAGRFKFLELPFERGTGHVTSKSCALLTVVLLVSLQTDADDSVAYTMVWVCYRWLCIDSLMV